MFWETRWVVRTGGDQEGCFADELLHAEAFPRLGIFCPQEVAENVRHWDVQSLAHPLGRVDVGKSFKLLQVADQLDEEDSTELEIEKPRNSTDLYRPSGFEG